MSTKEELLEAYLAGYDYAEAVEYGDEIYDENSFEVWYEKKLEDNSE